MTQRDTVPPFDTSAALTVLDGLRSQPPQSLPDGTDEAWDVAWIACLTNCPRWADRTERAFNDVVMEIARMVRRPP